jgi:hypothetical protein
MGTIVRTFFKKLDFMRLVEQEVFEQELRFYGASDKIFLLVLQKCPNYCSINSLDILATIL